MKGIGGVARTSICLCPLIPFTIGDGGGHLEKQMSICPSFGLHKPSFGFKCDTLFSKKQEITCKLFVSFIKKCISHAHHVLKNILPSLSLCIYNYYILPISCVGVAVVTVMEGHTDPITILMLIALLLVYLSP